MIEQAYKNLIETIVSWNSGKYFRVAEGETYKDSVFKAGVIAGLAARVNQAKTVEAIVNHRPRTLSPEHGPVDDEKLKEPSLKELLVSYYKPHFPKEEVDVLVAKYIKQIEVDFAGH